MADSPRARCTLRVIHVGEPSVQLLSLQSRRRKLWSSALGPGWAQPWRCEYRAECDVIGFNHSQLDLARPEQLRSTLGATDFDALINAAALTKVDHC
jgi:hypothetical protein